MRLVKRDLFLVSRWIEEAGRGYGKIFFFCLMMTPYFFEMNQEHLEHLRYKVGENGLILVIEIISV